MKKFIGAFFLGLFVFALSGAHPPREIPSALTPEETDALVAGRAGEETLPAEAFGYPDPRRVAALVGELDLNADQQEKLKNILSITQSRTMYFGKKVVAEELLLDDYFRKGGENYAELSNRLESIGITRWRLRLAHLEGYLKTKMILNSDQLRKYHQLRAAQPAGASAK